jgi:hypothetical protein
MAASMHTCTASYVLIYFGDYSKCGDGDYERLFLSYLFSNLLMT